MDKGGRGVPRPHTGPKRRGGRVREGERITETDRERGEGSTWIFVQGPPSS